MPAGPAHDTFDRMIFTRTQSGGQLGWMRATLALGILTFAGGTWLPAQKTAKPVNVDGKVLRNAGSVADDTLARFVAELRTQPERDPLQHAASRSTTTNAKRLGLAWTYAVGAGGGNQEGTPLVWNNTLYGITTWSVVYALDARTGKELWRWDPEVNQTAVRPKICCGIVNRGVALYNGTDHRPGDRRTAGLARRAHGQADVGIARGLSAGLVHADHGSAHRGRQSDHRGVGRRQMDARLLRRVRRQDRPFRPGSSTPFPAIPNCRRRTTP